MIITREKGMRMWGGGSGSTSASGVNGGGGFSLAVEEGEGTGNAYTDFTYESGTLTLNKATEFVTVDFFNKLFTAYDANGNVIAPNNTTPTLDNIKFMAGAWTEQYLSALGKNSEGGGGGGGIELSDVWQSLKTNTDDYANQKINSAHIPDLSGTYATKTWVNQQGFLTTHQTLYTLSIYGGTTKVLDFKPNANASIYIKAGGDISLANDTTNKYITLSYTHPTNGANTTISAANGKVLSAITVNNLGHVTSVSSKTLAAADIPDLSATYATASRATTLEGYFNSGGVAKVAAKLNTGTTTYTAWGQTYWSSGVPQSISGNMTSVGSITPSANGNALGTTSARFAIYGTSGNYSSTLTVADAITLSGSTAAKKRIYFGDTSHYLELDSTGFHFSHGVYSDGFVSALGANSSGGGSGTFDEEAMWTALGTTITAKVIASSHIPNLSWAKITSGKPTTLSGYGISDAYTKTQVDNALSVYLPLSGGTLTGTLTAPKIRINKIHGSSDTRGGIYYYDGTTDYLLIGQGSSNIWIGANETAGTHHTGATYISAGSGNAYISRLVNGSRVNYIILDAGNYSSYALPLTGGTLTGSLTVNNNSVTALGYNAKFDVDTSREIGLAWLNTSGTKVASVTYHNTYQKIIINPVGSSDTWDDAVGKYSLIVGNNSLTYNTYPILHSNNYSSYALPLSGGTLTGTLTAPKIRINKMHSSGDTRGGIYYYDGTTDYLLIGQGSANLWIGANETDGTHHTGGTYISAGSGDAAISRLVNGSRENYIILDAGNYSSYALPLSGGTLTGSLFVSNDLRVVSTTSGHLAVGSNLATYSVSRAEVDVVTPTDNPSEIWLGVNSTRVWSLSCRSTSEGSYFGIYNNAWRLTLTGSNLWVAGEITAASDARKKNIISNTKFNVKDIASARSILYEWNDGRDSGQVHGGSIAQDWLGKADSFLSQDNDGWYSINYGALALCSAITIAREVVKHEDEITRLKKVVVKQAEEIVSLKNKVSELEERRVA